MRVGVAVLTAFLLALLGAGGRAPVRRPHVAPRSHAAILTLFERPGAGACGVAAVCPMDGRPLRAVIRSRRRAAS